MLNPQESRYKSDHLVPSREQNSTMDHYSTKIEEAAIHHDMFRKVLFGSVN